ncbi:hypothetical protein B0T16DRAFT_458087 [Cercophora newfieldiana]|uniref:Uncharacterized protein n=1 Tax=Cercophora newfieldiana TaxID=92897 RepID=A0AA40CQU7_9PEZI|nr:hypothetical protein B0T16DRAFT_458087 [Cercophora newfieldiana]
MDRPLCTEDITCPWRVPYKELDEEVRALFDESPSLDLYDAPPLSLLIPECDFLSKGEQDLLLSFIGHQPPARASLPTPTPTPSSSPTPPNSPNPTRKDPDDDKTPPPLQRNPLPYALPSKHFNPENLPHPVRYPQDDLSRFKADPYPFILIEKSRQIRRITDALSRQGTGTPAQEIARAQVRRDLRRQQNAGTLNAEFNFEYVKTEAHIARELVSTVWISGVKRRRVGRTPGMVVRPCLRCEKEGIRCSFVTSLEVERLQAARCGACVRRGEGEMCVLRAEQRWRVCDWLLHEKKGTTPVVSYVWVEEKGGKGFYWFVRELGVNEERLREAAMEILRDDGAASLGSVGVYSVDSFENWALPAWELGTEPEKKPEEKEQGSDDKTRGMVSRVRPKQSPPPRYPPVGIRGLKR